MYDTYKRELDKIEEIDILKKIDEPTEFENAVVLVKKIQMDLWEFVKTQKI